MRSRDMFLPQMPSEEMALPGRTSEIKITDSHYILGSSQIAPKGNNLVFAMFGMGCLGCRKKVLGFRGRDDYFGWVCRWVYSSSTI